VIVHVVPAQENAGNRVRAPIVLPCVLDVAVKGVNSHYLTLRALDRPAISETRMVAVVPWKSFTLVI